MLSEYHALDRASSDTRRRRGHSARDRLGVRGGAATIYRPNPAAMKNLSAIAPSLDRLVAEESGQIVGTVRLRRSWNFAAT